MTRTSEGLRALTTDELDAIAGGARHIDGCIPSKGKKGPKWPIDPAGPIGPGGTGPTFPY
ncbi:MAG: hypothetical protein C3F17_00815 [Bradyrhizobiaceae bacterium]|nr:MAG: hypothetical protein C3F17_00815 [Bradyrhizobiaceae bacterium]